jgi:hypothetical protein
MAPRGAAARGLREEGGGRLPRDGELWLLSYSYEREVVLFCRLRGI